MPHPADAEVHLQQMFTLIDRIVDAHGITDTDKKDLVGAEESILPQLISHMDEHGLPPEVDLSYIVRPRWRADAPLYEQVRQRLTAETRFRAICTPDESAFGTDDEIPLNLRPNLAYFRTAWKPLPEFALIGGETALVKTRANDRYALVITVMVPELVRAMAEAFEHNWVLSITPEQYRRLRSALRRPTNQQVLSQLKDGRIDEVAAKQMDVSVRTYRRHVSSLMEVLQVDTRFQMAWRLAQLGV